MSRIPDSQGLRARLADIDAVVRETRWSMAALVAMQVGRVDSPENPDTAESLAARGFPGLQTVEDVEHYRKAWFSVFDFVPEPGQSVELPDIDFPEPQ